MNKQFSFLRTHFSRLALGLGLGLLFLTTLLLPLGAAHAQVIAPVHVSCSANACDNTDPTGLCPQIAADGSCANPYRPSVTPAPGSCSALGSRLAVSPFGDVPAAFKTITSSTGETVATALLIYSDQCKTNWVQVVLQGRCAVYGSITTPCSVSGDISRTAKNSRDGDAQHAAFLPPDPSGIARTAQLYAPDVPVQGCVSVTYPDGNSNIASPFVCITQPGW